MVEGWFGGGPGFAVGSCGIGRGLVRRGRFSELEVAGLVTGGLVGQGFRCLGLRWFGRELASCACFESGLPGLFVV